MAITAPARPMSSRIIGRVDLDDERLRAELRTLADFDYNRGYSEYSRGNPGWSNCVLMNDTGDHLDQTFGGYDGLPRRTKWGQRLSYLNEVIDETFHVEHLKWVRLFMCEDGMLIPHRDYLDLPEDEFLRIHIPLETGPRSLHSEADRVYHMNVGEIWFVDGTRIHSAYSFDGRPRIFLTFDFAAGVDFADLFRDRSRYADALEPEIVERLPFDDGQLESILGLGAILHEDNFDNVVEILAKIHFSRDVTCEVVYDWLVEIARRSGDVQLVERALTTKKFFLGE